MIQTGFHNGGHNLEHEREDTRLTFTVSAQTANYSRLKLTKSLTLCAFC